MLRKLGMALAAGVLVAGCGAVPTGTAPSAVTSEYSPTTTYSTPETSATSTTPTSTAPSTSVAPPVTTPPVVPPTTVAKPKTTPKAQAAPRVAPAQQPPVRKPAECGSDYYRNSSGNCVHRPDSNPSGATAQCKDGSYSYSQHRSGTCSGHGGVKQWL
ncbi:DUF3761 domain-containing protein [Amycolatopsis rubida]|uniref:DUF3761 domain-containing protein n=1 Tax=Amycolatopsis rubida TaxID=112413 RepID=A0A1I5IXW9_9PSEU|nr:MULTISPECIES: DUF3761 domain-containing protein [Amycolatopsis]MYW91275.1 DUF3761 domain-containing protein [Amycolatopsis rubida]NEC56260.1 DUF3761 domain-containing protein [Amycolatopsis rubida]OAP28849.1 hypothetical protein A4R44_00641 [Amycolatopsis sp. M39]SFO65368.1 Protein of unknown function [Amycolatopsis rubida]